LDCYFFWLGFIENLLVRTLFDVLSTTLRGGYYYHHFKDDEMKALREIK
jgi:hypothetical protein